ncbi:MAG: hypothetical protein MUP19_07040 [Candidatus Aminicenantes bacterium]|nr:hypothetical protein [Candidatus Aminicenantes bacterium]
MVIDFHSHTFFSDGLLLLAAILILISASAGLAQLTDEDISRRPFWEKFLSRAKVAGAEDIGEGVTRPKKLRLKRDEVEAFAVWKRPTGTGADLLDKWEHEIAAYRLDKLLGLNMVPPTIERSYHGYVGSLQLWVDSPYNELKLLKDKISVPPEKKELYDKAKSLQRAFDSLIANADRTLQNLRSTQDWRMILIDHSQSFRDTAPYAGRLIYACGDDPSRPGISRLPRGFVDKMRALTYEKIRAAVENYLTSSEITEVLVRRDLLLKEIEALIKDRSEAFILY